MNEMTKMIKGLGSGSDTCLFVPTNQYDLVKVRQEIKKIVQTGQVVTNFMLVAVPPEWLVYDKAYQENRNGKGAINTRRLEEYYNPHADAPIIVNYRNGLFYVMDGCHRTQNAINMGRKLVPVIVHIDDNLNGLDYADEAGAFSDQQSANCKMTQHDTFVGSVIYGDDIDCAIKRVCDDNHIEISRRSGPRTLTALGATRTMMRRFVKVFGTVEQAELGFRWILDVLREAKWLNQNGSLTDVVINGLAGVYEDGINDGHIDMYRDLLIQSLNDWPIKNFNDTLIAAWHMSSDKRRVFPLLLQCIIRQEVVLRAHIKNDFDLSHQLAAYQAVARNRHEAMVMGPAHANDNDAADKSGKRPTKSRAAKSVTVVKVEKPEH